MISRLKWQLRGSALGYRKIWHAPAFSAQRRSKYLHETGWRVVKPVLTLSEKGRVLALLPACCHLDVDKLAALLGATELALASEVQIAEAFPDCEPGALPGFGRPYRIATVIDLRLLEEPYLVVPGCCRHADYRMAVEAYLSLEQPIRGDIARPDALSTAQSVVAR